MKTTKKSVARILGLALVICLMASLAVPAAAANLESVKSVDEVKYGVFKFNLLFDKINISRGTAFLINDEYIVTAAHCVRFTEQEANTYGYTLDENR